MAQDVIITPASGEIDFQDNSSTVAKIDIDASNNLSITGAGSQTITLGQSGDTVSVAGSSFNPQCDINFTAVSGRGIYLNGTTGSQVYVKLLGTAELDLGSDNKIRLVESDGALPRAVFDLNSSKAKVGAAAGTTTPVATWQIQDNNESTTQTHFTQAVDRAGLLIETQYTANAFTPGLFWMTSNNSASKPKAGIYLKETGSGTYIYFGTSSNYATGITNDGLVLDYNGNVGIGTASPERRLHVNAGGLNFVAKFESTDDKASILIEDDNTLNYIHSQNGYLSLGGRDALDASNLNINSSNGNVGIGTTGPSYKLDVSGTSRFTELLRVSKGLTSDGAGKFYNWRAVNNTQSSTSNYIKIATIVGAQSTRFKIDLFGQNGYGGGGGDVGAMGYIVGQLNNDNNYDLVFYNHSNGFRQVVLEVGHVDVNTTTADVYIKVADYSEVGATGSITDGTITPLSSNTGSTGPTGYVTATERLVYNSGNDGSGSGLDADTLDGLQASSFLRSDAADTASGRITFSDGITLSGGTPIVSSSDADSYSLFGRAWIGFAGSHSDWAGFGHRDSRNAGGYAVLQNSIGNTLINSSTGQKIQFRENNSDRMVISNGNVGIGTTGPSAKFHVNGAVSDILAKFVDGSDGVNIATRGANRQQIDFLGSNTSAINAKGSLRINYDSDNNGTNDSIVFGRNGADESGTADLVITEGSVGIGTTSPNQKLKIVGNSARISIADSGNVQGVLCGLLSGGAGFTELFDASGTSKVVLRADGGANYIAGGGSVGIGTTSPVTGLHVMNSNLQVGLKSTHGYNTTVGRNTLTFNRDGNASYIDFAGTGNFLVFRSGSSFSEEVRFTTSGVTFNELGFDRDFRVETDSNTHAIFAEGSSNRVGIGTSSPLTNLHVNTSALFNRHFTGVHNYSYANGILIATSIPSTGNDTMFELFIQGNTYNNSKGPTIAKVQGYQYGSTNTIINASGWSTDPNMAIDAFHYNNRIYFFLNQTSLFQTYSYQMFSSLSTKAVITSVSNSAKPTTGVTNNVTVPMGKLWNSYNDGSGSGLDADTVDGIQGGNFLRSDTADTASGLITFNSGISIGGATIRDVTGSFGSIEVDGGDTQGYEGYSIGGRAVFMHNNSTTTGLYDDVGNRWLFVGLHGGESRMYYAGSVRIRAQANSIKLETPSGQVDIGPQSTGFCHMTTDRPRFYFNKELIVDGGTVASYDENLNLKAAHSSSTKDIIMTAGGSERARISSGGSVGIGTTGPSRSLDVAGSFTARYIENRLIQTFSTSSTAAAYYPIAHWGTTTSNRGTLKVYLTYTGGSWTPETYEIVAMMPWNASLGYIHKAHKYGAGGSQIQRVRLKNNSTNSVTYLEVYVASNSNGQNFQVRAQLPSYHDGSIALEAPALAASTNTGTTLNEKFFINSTARFENLAANGNVYLGRYLFHDGDTDTYFDFDAADSARIVTGGLERIKINNSGIVINEGGNSYDFRVESDNNSNMLVVDGSANRVGIGRSPTGYTLEVEQATAGIIASFISTDAGDNHGLLIRINQNGDGTAEDNTVTLTSSGSNSGSLAFARGNSEVMRVAATDRVGIGTKSPARLLDVSNAGQITFGDLVSGTPSVTPGIFWHSGDDYAIFRSSGSWTSPNYQQLKIRWATGIILDPGTGTHAKSHVGVVGGVSIGDSYYTVKEDNGLIVQGSVGIGTTGPSYKLDINGQARIVGSGTIGASSLANAYLLLGNTSTGLGIDTNEIYTNNSNLHLGTLSNHGIYFQEGSTIKMLIDNNGDVGIGTTSPSDGDLTLNTPKLHVSGITTSSAYNLVARFQAGSDNDNTGAAILINHSNDRGLLIEAGRASSDRAVAYFGLVRSNGTNNRILTIVQDGGNVGVGTTTPTYKFEVNDDATDGKGLKVTGGGNGGPLASFTRDVGSTGSSININCSGGDPQFQLVSTSNTFAMGTDGGLFKISDNNVIGTNDRLTINTSGNVGIGTTSPGEQLHVANTIYAGSNIGAAGKFYTNTAPSRNKISLYGNGGTYTIGMQSGITYGSLSDWAMTFQFNNEADRGFWWGDTAHSTAQGAMSLTTHGYLTVAARIKVGGGESDTTGPQYPLEVQGQSYLNGNVGISTTSPTQKLQVVGNGFVDTNYGFGGQGNCSHIAVVGGGDFRTQTSTLTGYLKITVPNGFSGTMLLWHVDVYEYFTGGVKTFILGGYPYNAETKWYNVSAILLNDGGDTATYTATFTHDGTNACVYIADNGASSSWSYPQVRIKNVSAGFSNVNINNWLSGWDIGFTTTLNGSGASTNVSRTCGLRSTSGPSSDYRIKENLEVFDYGYELVKEVNSYSFTYKKDINPESQPVIPSYNREVPDIGFLAHELQEATKKITGTSDFKPVEGEKDQFDSEQGRPIYQKVHYEKLTPVLWSALKETIAKVEILEKRIKDLENGKD